MFSIAMLKGASGLREAADRTTPELLYSYINPLRELPALT